MSVGTFTSGDNFSQNAWVATATSNLDMNNFSLVNVNTIQILQTATTGQALEVYRNLAAASTDSPIVCFANLNAGDDQSVLTVTSAANAAASNPMVLMETTDAAFDQPLLSIVSDGVGYGLLIVTNQNAGAVVSLVYYQATDAAYDQEILQIVQDGAGGGILLEITAAAGGKALEIDQDGDAYGIEIQSAATTNTQYGLQVVTGAGATAANIQYSGNEFIRLGMHNEAGGTSWFYRNLAAADTAGAVVFIEQDNAADDQRALNIQNDGTGEALYIIQNAESESIFISSLALTSAVFQLYAENTDGNIFEIRSEGVHTDTSNAVMRLASSDLAHQATMFLTSQAGTGTGIRVDQNGAGIGLLIDHDDTGTNPSLKIDRDGNNAADIWAVEIDCDNAGAGVPGGIDL